MSEEYPVSEKRPESLRTPSGRPFTGLTLDAALDGSVEMADLRVTAEALAMQAEIARRARRPQLAENFLRAAELVGVPDEEILAIYNALRPGRASGAQLRALAGEVEAKYHAPRCAALLREAAEGR
jgi:propanediol dehydratase small subunit